MEKVVDVTIYNFEQVQITDWLDGGERCVAGHLSS
jgi:hypothetical protein